MVKLSFEEWIQFFESTLLIIGSALLLSGIFFLVAFNWNQLDGFTKLGLVGSLNLIAYLFTIFFRKKSFYFEIGLTIIFFLTASALFTFGQIYQTGADVYDLFWGWAGLTFLLLFVSRSGVVTAFWFVLLAVTVYLYAHQVSDENKSYRLFTFTSVLFGGMVVAFDWIKTNFYSDKTKVFLSALGLCISLFFLQSVAQELLWTHNETKSSLEYGFYQILIPLISFGLYYSFYRFVRFQLLNLTIILFFGLGQVFLFAVDVFQIWAYSSGVSFLLFALWITGYTLGAVTHLNHLRKANRNQGN